MRRRRAVVIMVSCVVGAMLGLGSAMISDMVMGRCSSGASGATGCEEKFGSSAMTPGAPIISTATRHVAGPGEPRPPGPNPATDRAMVLLVGWSLLVIVGSGLCTRSRRRETPPEERTMVSAVELIGQAGLPVPEQRGSRRLGPRQLSSPALDRALAEGDPVPRPRDQRQAEATATDWVGSK